MVSFHLHNPTEIVFGAGQIGALDRLIGRDESLLLLFGGGSIHRNGVHAEVRKALGERTVVEFGGVEPNPRYETLQQAARLVREKKVDLILGVGGGSVVDAAKFLAYLATSDGDDPWESLQAGAFPDRVLPVGAVLTLPATGSESNPVSVISSAARGLKYPFNNPRARPRFAVLDPSTMASLDRRQRANGAVDAFTHVLEQYLTFPHHAPIQYGFSETLLEALIEWGPRLVRDNSPEAREIVMWAANQALNGLIGAGISQDWSTHYIGHALTALCGIDHARSLSLVMPAVFRFKREEKQAMLARYARRVWKIDEPDDAKAAGRAIAATEDWFRSIGLPVGFADMPEIGLSADGVVAHIDAAGQFPLGEGKDIGADEVRAILKLAS